VPEDNITLFPPLVLKKKKKKIKISKIFLAEPKDEWTLVYPMMGQRTTYDVKLLHSDGTETYHVMTKDDIIRLGEKNGLCAGLRFLTECHDF
jgi:hypothetical protein